MEKRKIRVAIGCDAGRVPRKHFGDCSEFRIYEINEDGVYTLIETKPNTSPEERRHADPNKMKGVLGELPGCEVIISGLLSPNFQRIRDTKPVQPVVTTLTEIPQLLEAFTARFEEIHSLVEARRQGDRPAEIPVLE